MNRMPDYKVMPDGAVRVLHLDLDKSWWKRGMSPWERDVAQVEGTIRLATGLRRVLKRHGRCYVELRVRSELVARAVTAVRLEHGKPSEISLLNGS